MTSSKNSPRIPVTLIAGFLGAGKTTLLNHILSSDHGVRAAVLVNDFGSINIYAKLIVGVEGDTVNLANGCVCCTIRDVLTNTQPMILCGQLYATAALTGSLTYASLTYLALPEGVAELLAFLAAFALRAAAIIFDIRMGPPGEFIRFAKTDNSHIP